MAKITGKNCTLVLTGVTVDPTEMISIIVSPTGEHVENTGMGDDWQTFLAAIGGKGCTIDINGYNSAEGTPPSGSLRKAILDTWAASGHKGTFTIKPTGAGQTITGELILDSSAETWAKAAAAVMNCSGTVNGAISGL